MNTTLGLLLLMITVTSQAPIELPPPCDSEIYCHGRLLDTIQSYRVYPDSKTFVDMKLKKSPEETLKLFDEFIEKNKPKPTQNAVTQFVKDNFEPAGMEFEDWDPSDWTSEPKFLDAIKDPLLKNWAKELNGRWKELGRKMKAEVKENGQFYSIIWVPNPVIVPGGRFREFYYWDSYWIIHGLLLSEMHATVKGMLENFIYIVNQFGLVPNGGRIYYTMRSQPPLLIPMVKTYLDYTNDKAFITANIATLEKEFNFWMTNHTKVIKVKGKTYTLAAYGDRSSGPRPESYVEDVASGKSFKDSASKLEFYSQLKAAAESGWDFSSRWFIPYDGKLASTKIRSILPVDLNSILYWNAEILSEFYHLIGNEAKSKEFKDKAATWLEAVEAVLWHEQIGAWLDFDTINEKRRDYFFPSNIAPLWTGCYNKENKSNMVKRILGYLQSRNIIYPGGVPTSITVTGQQWDFPNVWPPLQHMMIVALNNTEDEFAMRLAFSMAQLWVKSNYAAFKRTGQMYEKYDAATPGVYGGGGEYAIQLGFGWTNGVIMDLLYRYGDKLTAGCAFSGVKSITLLLIAMLGLTVAFLE